MAHTLPHTGISLPTPIEVSGFDQIELSTGVAYTTTLHIDGTRIGQIENDGRGGDTWLRTTNAHRPAWKALVEGARDQDGSPMGETDLYERLVDEAEMAKQVRAASKARGRYAIRLTDAEGVHAIILVTHQPWAGTYPAPRQLVNLQAPAGTVRAAVWHGAAGGWVNCYPLPVE
ncbi:hypothetical protein ACWFMI_23690 [Nocardiopsis terrae]|uniref:hypothetical protein n=1 Tax=Streptomyces sp. NPDC057554 TaxID=3350538 RepID=UPI0036CBFA3B